jgi:endo-alpha-1,4-polygalactosaminidase (GH114 family)
MPNGAYLVNGEGDDGHKSGIAWYANLDHNNFGVQPDAYIDIGHAGHYVRWENQELKGWPIPSLRLEGAY